MLNYLYFIKKKIYKLDYDDSVFNGPNFSFKNFSIDSLLIFASNSIALYLSSLSSPINKTTVGYPSGLYCLIELFIVTFMRKLADYLNKLFK